MDCGRCCAALLCLRLQRHIPIGQRAGRVSTNGRSEADQPTRSIVALHSLAQSLSHSLLCSIQSGFLSPSHGGKSRSSREEKQKEVRAANLIAAKAVADHVMRTIGLKGRDKISDSDSDSDSEGQDSNAACTPHAVDERLRFRAFCRPHATLRRRIRALFRIGDGVELEHHPIGYPLDAILQLDSLAPHMFDESDSEQVAQQVCIEPLHVHHARELRRHSSDSAATSSTAAAMLPFFPLRLLDDGSCVVMRFRLGLSYVGVSEAVLQQVEQKHREQLPAKEAEVTTCEKLLDQLKEALSRSEKAEEDLVAAVASDESEDIVGIGALKIEQRRITLEMGTQKMRLEQLRQACLFSPSTLWSQWEDVELALDVVFVFGLNQWEGQLYRVSRIEQSQVEPGAADSSSDQQLQAEAMSSVLAASSSLSTSSDQGDDAALD